LTTSVRTVHSGSSLFQCRYVSPSSPGAVFSNFPSRLETLTLDHGPPPSGIFLCYRLTVPRRPGSGPRRLVPRLHTTDPLLTESASPPSACCAYIAIGSLWRRLGRSQSLRPDGQLDNDGGLRSHFVNEGNKFNHTSSEQGSARRMANHPRKACYHCVMSSGIKWCASSSTRSAPASVSGRGTSRRSSSSVARGGTMVGGQ